MNSKLSPVERLLDGITVLLTSQATTLRGASPAFLHGLVAVVLAAGCCQALAGDAAPAHERQVELVNLIRNDCGSCHGLRLSGGLGPSLLPLALRDKPLQSLRQTILQGRPGTAMPPWERFVSESEADWMVRQLLVGLPDVP